MDVVVSNNAKKYDGFIKVSKLQEALSLTGDIDTIVIHKTNESKDEKVKYLTQLKDCVKDMVYIRDKDSVDSVIQMFIIGSGGKYFDDEFFLGSGEDLRSLLNNLGSSAEISKMGGVNVLGDFFNRYLENSDGSFSKQYLLMVKQAVSSMIVEYRQKDLELLQLSESATEIFINSTKLISNMEKEREDLKESFSKLKEGLSSNPVLYSNKSISNGSQNIVFFPQVSYLKEQQIIRIKKIGDVLHLVPFCLGLRMYLESIKLLRVKLIVLCPVGELFEETYKDYEWVTQSNVKDMRGYSNVVFTNFPTKDVITRLLDNTDSYDTFIVVDLLTTSRKHLLNSRGRGVNYALSSVKSVEKYKLKLNDCFFNKSVKGAMFSLKDDIDFPEDKEQRERYYLREYKDVYELFNF